MRSKVREETPQTKDAKKQLSNLTAKTTPTDGVPETEQAAVAKEAAVDSLPGNGEAQAGEATILPPPTPPPTDGVPETQQEAAAKEAAIDAAQGVQPPEQIGKGSLPSGEDEDEDQDVDDEEEEQEQEQEQEPVFTDEDKADYASMKARRLSGEVEKARIDRDVRKRKLWMLERGPDGNRKYQTYDQYCQEELDCSRQAVTQRTNWLAAIEKLEELHGMGADVPTYLSPYAVTGLYNLAAAGGFQGKDEDEQQQAGLIAALQEAKEDGVTYTRDNLRPICQRRAGYFDKQKGKNPFKAATYEQHKQNMAILEPLADVSRDWSIWDGAKDRAVQDSVLFEEALLEQCKDRLALPKDEHLLTYASGDDLQKVVDILLPIGQGFILLREQEEAHKKSLAAAKQAKEKEKQLRQVYGIKGKPKKNTKENGGADTGKGEPDAGKGEPEKEQAGSGHKDEFSLDDDPRKKAEADGTNYSAADLASIAADCLADACQRDLQDAEAVLDRARKAKEWAEKLIELCEAKEPVAKQA